MKNFFFLLLVLFCQNSKALTIQQLTVTTIENSNDLNIHTKVGNGSYFEYFNHGFELNNGIITLNICYSPYLMQVATIKENDFVLPNVNLNNTAYTLVVNVNFQIWNGTEYSCNNQILSDTATLSFETPLNNAVYLSNSDLSVNQSQLFLYPNPTQGSLTYNQDFSPGAKSVCIYDSLGRAIYREDNLNHNTLDISGFSNGVYFVEFTTAEQQRFAQQIILKK
ncbi:MAG: T9SS type A sorting domain-containing protein [Flavobacteriaceae bacterium]